VHAQHITDHQLKETETSTQVTLLFWTNVPGKNPMRENRRSYLRVLFIKQFQNTIWVPNLAHPTEKNLGSSTSPSETYASAETPENTLTTPQLQSAPRKFPASASSALCVSYPGNFSYSRQFQLLPFASAFLAVPDDFSCSWQFRLLPFASAFSAVPVVLSSFGFYPLCQISRLLH